MTHDFQMFWSFLPEAQDALQQAGSFVHDLRTRQLEPTADGG